jgi:Domain of unknown function (DUF1707)
VSGSGEARALRLSDLDREQAVNDLKAHATAGRLSIEELSNRVAAAYAAETFGELADLMRDLPELGGAGTVAERAAKPRQRGRPRWPGVAPFTEIIEVPLPPAEVRQRILEILAPSLARAGYELVDPGESQLAFAQKHGVLWERRSAINLRFEPLGDGGTRMLAHGSGPLRVRRGFAELREL